MDEKLSPLDINVVCLPFNQPNDFNQELTTLAEMLGPEEEKRSQDFIHWKQDSLDNLQKEYYESWLNVPYRGVWVSPKPG